MSTLHGAEAALRSSQHEGAGIVQPDVSTCADLPDPFARMTREIAAFQREERHTGMRLAAAVLMLAAAGALALVFALNYQPARAVLLSWGG
jgi:hypothetical protein